MKKTLSLPHGNLALPAFLPDATRGVVRSIDSTDLENAGINALVMNTFHLMQNPGSSTIRALGGLHDMTGWQRPIITDSGGFQVYSLIRQNAKFGSLSDKGATFKIDGRKFNLTPEKSVQLQMSYGADVIMCFDDCTHVDASLDEQQASVKRTIDWAKRCKAEYELQIRQQKIDSENRPLIFGVIQGGGHLDLRKKCAEALLEIGFDGFGYGGWPLDSNNNLLTDIIGYTRGLVPGFPMHALGIGHPPYIVEAVKIGYEMFDSAMPTRDARNGRLYTFTTNTPNFESTKPDWFAYLYAEDKKHIKTNQPISPYCDCPTCTRYSLGYLNHLFSIKDTLALRLATLHNLHFMAQLMQKV